ncbi:phenylalanine 4-monooxygenase [Marinobacterium zhoushanense]|uniref:phenylalanine 4-monooxygenase n=1 Tax=Marinobacterium zhoushanense TaxID=1679163 RepID=A0ABQ1KHD4_9GAMM|nr:phenylalanine 4-monooxygenase [Marinobacterium zhoushanense]GGB94522.1 phenylalanine 4-monooxygenase [Marinobacterium zhoushanense]
MKKVSRYQAYQPDASGYIPYSREDDSIWHDLIVPQRKKAERYCSQVFLKGLAKLDLDNDRIPQCLALSEQLQKVTGWSVTPVPALISFDRFYSLLAERRFPAASFIRSREEMEYLQEPDIFHEIFGHTPLLATPDLAEFSHRIGLIGSRARSEDHVWLARLYWFTVEFGLIREHGQIRSLGAGLASSSSELPYAVESDIPLRQPFDLLELLRTPYRIDIHQPTYFVLDGVDQLLGLSEKEILSAIKQARAKGLHAPLYAPKAS